VGNGRSDKVGSTTPLGMTVYERSGFGRLPPGVRLADRIELLVNTHGAMTLSQLHRALHCAADQDRLHRAIAELRDRGAVTVGTERRHRAGRARMVVTPLPRQTATLIDEDASQEQRR
jgi:hypothetical protein